VSLVSLVAWPLWRKAPPRRMALRDVFVGIAP